MKFLQAVGFVVVAILTVLAAAFTLSTLWGWFIVPLGAPAIGLAHAAGISVMLTYLKMRQVKQKDERPFLDKVSDAYGRMIVVLLLGYIIKLFM